ncbi:hypothetical protein [Cupriavidus campinensis]|uniref:Uncharacterized protein n=1 Tax=Cupriavidus campinensis TaxID=151783 RepID=A0AAE9I0E2_9BURK|nr:hypothetical protein [Cupriavidus campinensis]URF05268.1 hypothetical protein M5D45_05455 [Cupriavidus campinensis]
MLHAILKLFRARQASQAAALAAAPAPKLSADKPRQDRRKLKRAKRRASPGTRKIDPNGPWLEQARGINNGR